MEVVPEQDLPTRWLGNWAVIVPPEEIDVSNSLRVREALVAAVGRRPAGVILDMTGTTFCDSSGIAAIAIAYQHIGAAGADMRLVVGHPAVLRVFEFSGLVNAIDTYPDLPAALPRQPKTADPDDAISLPPPDGGDV
jgi:anti-sigma B factor antagonist